jgi:hypothetical protein
MRLRPLLALSITAFPLVVAAQTPPPAAAGSLIPPSTCVKPEFSARLANDPNMTAFNRNFKAYGECVKKYVDQNKAIAEAATAAANRVVDEYNTYTADIKAKIEAENNARQKETVK